MLIIAMIIVVCAYICILVCTYLYVAVIFPAIVDAVKKAWRKFKASQAHLQKEASESSVEATPPKWGPEVPGTTQIAPGLYRINKARSIFNRQEDKKKEE